MKTILIIGLLTASLLVLIISIDYVMYGNLLEVLHKEYKPFKVTEETELITLILFALYFIVKAVVGFFKKKQSDVQKKPN
ncbi:hypothetical protein [Neobacillus sp. LXY-1]|uniref:hypothetical protein n=1 Tax=Neobacillus sp. LXY-1 TaxID=3379133 RepID=UPI003EE0137D